MYSKISKWNELLQIAILRIKELEAEFIKKSFKGVNLNRGIKVSISFKVFLDPVTQNMLTHECNCRP